MVKCFLPTPALSVDPYTVKAEESTTNPGPPLRDRHPAPSTA